MYLPPSNKVTHLPTPMSKASRS